MTIPSPTSTDAPNGRQIGAQALAPPMPESPAPSDADRLAEIRDRVDAASGEPWGVATTDGMGFAVHHGEHDTVALYCDRPDATFIAHARADVPWLLAQLERVTAERDGARDEVEHFKQRLHVRYGELDEANTRCDRLEALANSHYVRAEKAESEQAYTYGIARKAHARAEVAEAALERVRKVAIRWQQEADERGPEDRIYAAGAASMILAALDPAATTGEETGA